MMKRIAILLLFNTILNLTSASSEELLRDFEQEKKKANSITLELERLTVQATSLLKNIKEFDTKINSFGLNTENANLQQNLFFNYHNLSVSISDYLTLNSPVLELLDTILDALFGQTKIDQDNKEQNKEFETKVELLQKERTSNTSTIYQHLKNSAEAVTLGKNFLSQLCKLQPENTGQQPATIQVALEIIKTLELEKVINSQRLQNWATFLTQRKEFLNNVKPSNPPLDNHKEIINQLLTQTQNSKATQSELFPELEQTQIFLEEIVKSYSTQIQAFAKKIAISSNLETKASLFGECNPNKNRSNLSCLALEQFMILDTTHSLLQQLKDAISEENKKNFDLNKHLNLNQAEQKKLISTLKSVGTELIISKKKILALIDTITSQPQNPLSKTTIILDLRKSNTLLQNFSKLETSLAKTLQNPKNNTEVVKLEEELLEKILIIAQSLDEELQLWTKQLASGKFFTHKAISAVLQKITFTIKLAKEINGTEEQATKLEIVLKTLGSKLQELQSPLDNLFDKIVNISEIPDPKEKESLKLDLQCKRVSGEDILRLQRSLILLREEISNAGLDLITLTEQHKYLLDKYSKPDSPEILNAAARLQKQILNHLNQRSFWILQAKISQTAKQLADAKLNKPENAKYADNAEIEKITTTLKKLEEKLIAIPPNILLEEQKENEFEETINQLENLSIPFLTTTFVTYNLELQIRENLENLKIHESDENIKKIHDNLKSLEHKTTNLHNKLNMEKEQLQEKLQKKIESEINEIKQAASQADALASLLKSKTLENQNTIATFAKNTTLQNQVLPKLNAQDKSVAISILQNKNPISTTVFDTTCIKFAKSNYNFLLFQLIRLSKLFDDLAITQKDQAARTNLNNHNLIKKIPEQLNFEKGLQIYDTLLNLQIEKGTEAKEAFNKLDNQQQKQILDYFEGHLDPALNQTDQESYLTRMHQAAKERLFIAFEKMIEIPNQNAPDEKRWNIPKIVNFEAEKLRHEQNPISQTITQEATQLTKTSKTILEEINKSLMDQTLNNDLTAGLNYLQMRLRINILEQNEKSENLALLQKKAQPHLEELSARKENSALEQLNIDSLLANPSSPVAKPSNQEDNTPPELDQRQEDTDPETLFLTTEQLNQHQDQPSLEPE